MGCKVLFKNNLFELFFGRNFLRNAYISAYVSDGLGKESSGSGKMGVRARESALKREKKEVSRFL